MFNGYRFTIGLIVKAKEFYKVYFGEESRGYLLCDSVLCLLEDIYRVYQSQLESLLNIQYQYCNSGLRRLQYEFSDRVEAGDLPRIYTCICKVMSDLYMGVSWYGSRSYHT